MPNKDNHISAWADQVVRIREAVEAAGGPTAVARASRLSRRTINAYMVGETTPSAERLVALARGTGFRPEYILLGVLPKREEGVREPSLTYTADGIDPQLIGECFESVMEALERHPGPRPPSSKIGAAMAEIYTICQRDGRKPTDDLVASYIRVLRA